MALSNVVVFTHTATDDNKFNLTSSNFWCREVNIHVANNACKYGDVNSQPAQVNADNGISFQDVNLKDIFFRNATAGANTTIYAVAVKMTEGRMRELGVL